MIIETFRQAIQNVWSNKLRTFLTMLGIIIGVMAVIVIVGLGNGMTKSMRDSFSALGTNTLSVQVWGNGSRTVSVEEMYKLPTEYPELIQSISPQIDFSGSGTLKDRHYQLPLVQHQRRGRELFRHEKLPDRAGTRPAVHGYEG